MDDVPLVMEVWWDPKRRTMMVNPHTIVCGILLVVDDFIAFASPDRVEFAANLSDICVNWARVQPRGEFTTPDGLFRLYLAYPVAGAPRLHENMIETIAEKFGDLNDVSDAGELFGVGASTVENIVGVIGDGLKLVYAVANLTAGYRQRAALQLRINAAAANANNR